MRYPIVTEPARPMPPLDDSDSALRKALATVIGDARFAALFYPDALVRRIVATVDNLPRRKAPRAVIPVKPAQGRFETVATSRGPVIDRENAHRYMPYVALARSVDARALVAAYGAFYPLFQRAYGTAVADCTNPTAPEIAAMFEIPQKHSKLDRLRAVRVPLWIVLALLAMLAVALVAQPLLLRKPEREREVAVREATDRASADAETARKQAEAALGRASDDAYRLFGTALSWALRSAWMRHNMDELDQFVAELVRNESIRLVAVADNKARIVSASDLDMKGALLSQRFPDAGLSSSSPSIERTGARARRLVVPVFGVTSRLGTAVIVYEAPALEPR